VNTYPLSDPVTFTFVLIPILLVIVVGWGLHHASRRLGDPDDVRRRLVTGTVLCAAVWMALTWLAARSGVLLRWDLNPPPFVGLLVGILALAGLLSFGASGDRLARGVPLWALVAVQGFRLPLELAMHALSERGIMPEQMTYTGWNFDIVTGLTALGVALAIGTGRAGAGLVRAWNVLGLALLVNVVAIAILSTPRFRLFGDTQVNVFVMYAPFVWLPSVMVLAAFAGHLIVFRALHGRASA
jgi:hypothetical protein